MLDLDQGHYIIRSYVGSICLQSLSADDKIFELVEYQCLITQIGNTFANKLIPVQTARREAMLSESIYLHALASYLKINRTGSGNCFLQFWKGALGPFRWGNLAW